MTKNGAPRESVQVTYSQAPPHSPFKINLVTIILWVRRQRLREVISLPKDVTE